MSWSDFYLFCFLVASRSARWRFWRARYTSIYRSGCTCRRMADITPPVVTLSARRAEAATQGVTFPGSTFRRSRRSSRGLAALVTS